MAASSKCWTRYGFMVAVMCATLLVASCAGGSARQARPDRGVAPAVPEVVLAGDALIFLEMDANRDRVVDRGELNAWQAQEWTAASRGAASLSQMQFQQWQVAMFGDTGFAGRFGFYAFDENLDQGLSAEEFQAELERRFAATDRNADDLINRAELFVRLPRPPSMPSGMRRPPAGGPSGGGPPGGGRRPLSEENP